MKTRHHNNRPARPVRPPDDPAVDWNEKVVRAAAVAMAQWLKGSVHLSRPISSLKLHEVEVLAQTAIHTWIIEASRRLNAAKGEEREQIRSLLS